MVDDYQCARNRRVALFSGMKTVTLDVRPVIQAGGEPFSLIMNAVDELGPEDSLRLLAPFPPAPLYNLMMKKGFSNVPTPLDDGGWASAVDPP